VQLAEGIMGDLWRDFWIRETGTGQQVAKNHDRYDDDNDDDHHHHHHHHLGDRAKLTAGYGRTSGEHQIGQLLLVCTRIRFSALHVPAARFSWPWYGKVLSYSRSHFERNVTGAMRQINNPSNSNEMWLGRCAK